MTEPPRCPMNRLIKKEKKSVAWPLGVFRDCVGGPVSCSPDPLLGHLPQPFSSPHLAVAAGFDDGRLQVLSTCLYCPHPYHWLRSSPRTGSQMFSCVSLVGQPSEELLVRAGPHGHGQRVDHGCPSQWEQLSMYRADSQGAWAARSAERATLDSGAVRLSPTLGVERT